MVGAIAGILIDWGVSKAADVLFDQAGNQIKTRLNKDDLQQAIAQLPSSILQQVSNGEL